MNLNAVHGEPLLGVIRVCYNIALHRYFSYEHRVAELTLSVLTLSSADDLLFELVARVL